MYKFIDFILILVLSTYCADKSSPDSIHTAIYNIFCH